MDILSVEQAQSRYDEAVKAQQQAESVVKERVGTTLSAMLDLERAKQKAAEAVPVDRDAVMLSGGRAVDGDHRELNPATGQQKGYVVLTQAERAKGFVRPVRTAYRHQKCDRITTMSRDIAETYARDPSFYSGTFCSTCRAHFPVGEDGEFTWYENDGSEGPKVGT